jgi:hypothetical protein
VWSVLAPEQPVLVSVDDLQWLDPPKRSFLEFAARRLRREPVVLLLARRLPGPERAALVARGVLAGEVWRIEFGPPSLGAVSAIRQDGVMATE